MTGRVLVIAGSDSGGGAGIQADVKTINSLGVFAATAITAVTAQNTLGVQAVHPIPPEIIKAQITAVLTDIGADVVKIGMLAQADVITAVAEALEENAFTGAVVLDPVMVATSGDHLLDANAIELLKTRMIPFATVLTPNIPEAIALTGHAGKDMADLAKALTALGAGAVLLKGGHLKTGDSVTDLLLEGETTTAMTSPRIDTRSTHGTGCSLASGIAAHLARGERLRDAAQMAHLMVHQAILDAPNLGQGHGPLGHHRIRRP